MGSSVDDIAEESLSLDTEQQKLPNQSAKEKL